MSTPPSEAWSVIIATHERADLVLSLIQQIRESDPRPQEILVVDSSQESDSRLSSLETVRLIRPSHPNQPYQRFVGYLAARSDLLVFLDDDVTILQPDWLERLASALAEPGVVAVQPKVRFESAFLAGLPRGVSAHWRRYGLGRILKILSGNGPVSPGGLSYNGRRGAAPDEGGCVQWFIGAAFAVRRSALYGPGFNFKLFDIFEEKVGMGEDTLLGLDVSHSGCVRFLNSCLIAHEDRMPSHYADRLFDYARRVAYSRLYLSLEFARLTSRSPLVGLAHYHWYMLWRLLGISVASLVSRDGARGQLARGMISGWKAAARHSRELSYVDSGAQWRARAVLDLERYLG